MVVYILHNDKIVPFELPKDISGSYTLVDEIAQEKKGILNIDAVDGQWRAFSNEDAVFVDGQNALESVILQPYNFYRFILYGNEARMFYVAPAYEKDLVLKKVLTDTTIIVGSGPTSDMLYNFPGVAENQLQLIYKDAIWSFKNLNPSIPIYINTIRKDQGLLNNFDSIFILGFKLIIVGPYILIKDPTGLMVMNTQKIGEPDLQLIVQDYDVKGIVYKDFYEEKDYFVKSPLFENNFKVSSIEIAQPPNIVKQKQNSFLMDVIPAALMSVTSVLGAVFTLNGYKNGEVNFQSFINTMITCAVMLISGLLWPFVQKIYNANKNRVEIKKNIKLYTKYLDNKKEELEQLKVQQAVVLKDKYISLSDCLTAILKKNAYLFSKNVDSEDFLSVRLGSGNVKFQVEIAYKKPEFVLEYNKLYDDIDKLIDQERFVENVPVSLSFKDYNIVSFLENNVYRYDYMKSILLQLMILHSYSDLKIVVFTDSIGKNELSFIKNLNHCWDNTRSIRFFASDISEAQDISSYLEDIFMKRKNTKEGEQVSQTPYYLIFSDNISMYRNLNIINDILLSKESCGFGLVMFGSKMSDIPNQCKYFVNYSATEASCFGKEVSQEKSYKFVPEYFNYFDKNVDISLFASLLANIPLKIDDEVAGNLPTKLGFLEMYGVGKVERLNSEERWKTSDVVNTLSAPVGVDVNGNIINLDLHEKRHGPHGLVAGMTGSGKSEFIVTYILSLAVNYSPEEVQFVLIDYKGGGLAGAFENRQTGVKLPHLAGTITNLDQAEMNRTLVSIQSELQRRQRKFNEVKEELNTGTIDIYKYQRLYREGKLSEPMSHLFIISDEFAELKAQQPEFMDQLVSAARIGRSLGIHLILATQKPSGVVDEQIWSNSKFKVCCKVQTAADSQEMLGKPDAAFLKDSGRFYLQVGYDIYYILGQSAYSGSAYVPSDKIITNVDNSLDFVNYVGEVIKSLTVGEDPNATQVKKPTIDLGEELSNILKYVISVSEKNKYDLKKLWLDNIPSVIYLGNVIDKYKNKVVTKKNFINPVIGEYDDPEHQSQGVVTLPITLGGNCCVGGVSGSGKSTFISTFVYSTIIKHSVDEVNFYIIDFGNETLKKFKKAPHVGDVLISEDVDKINVLFNRISYEIARRKEILSELDLTYLSYIEKEGMEPLPNIIVIINGYDAFKEKFSDFVSEKFASILRESSKFGINFIITCTSSSSMFASHLDMIPQRIAFKFPDESMYNDFLNSKTVPADNPGRGITLIDNKPYQFQSALILTADKLQEILNKTFDVLSNQMPNRAPEVPVMPDFVMSSEFEELSTSLSKVPVGYDINTINPCFYDFDQNISLVLTSKDKNLSSFVKATINLVSKLPDTKVIILDGKQNFSRVKNDDTKYYDSSFSKLIEFLSSSLDKYENQEGYNTKFLVFIFGYEDIQKYLKDMAKQNGDGAETVTNVDDLESLISKAVNSRLFRFVICGRYSQTRVFENESWFNSLPNKTGIVLGDYFRDQEIIRAKKIEDEYSIEITDERATVVKDTVKTIVNYISD